MNIITFDLEEWYNEKQIYSGREYMFQQYDSLFLRLLDELDTDNIKATFFCVGKLAEMRPEFLKLIVARGHEVGCHSNTHTWLNKLSYNECEDDTRIAIDSLEQCTGVKVKSYRAPAFSIGSSNPWALEILAKYGVENDASIFPAARDFGGFDGFASDRPCIVRYNGIHLREFPISVEPFIGRKLIFSGGGYFRLIPLPLINFFVNRRDYTIFYFHLNDMVSEAKRMMTREEYENYFKEDGSFRARFVHHIKNSIGSGRMFDKLMKVFDEYDFINIDQACEKIDWGKVPEIIF